MAQLVEHILLHKEFPLILHNEDFTQWEGYLKSTVLEQRIKLFTPFYPELKDIYFECSLLIKKCLISHLENMRNCNTLRALLYYVDHTLKTESSSVTDILWDSKFIKSTHIILSELESVLEKENILKISENFRDITVKYMDSECSEHIFQFSAPGDYPKGELTILDADLPTDVLAGLTKISSIDVMYNLFKQSVENLIPFWKMCKALEEKAWVIDPTNPQKKDIYRRILISDHLSLVLTFNPLDLSTCPDVKFLGSMKAVAEAREKYLKNIEVYGWMDDLEITENIVNLLDIKELPLKNKNIGSSNDENNCYICFTYIVDDEQPPAKWCTNKNCSSWYHYSCLIQWLETVITSVRLYDHISGPCPYCDEKLWCPLNIDSK